MKTHRKSGINFKTIIIAGVMFIVANTLLAQQSVVEGKVTAAEGGEVLPGVSVIVKGTNDGTVTTFDGDYSLNLDPSATLIFSYIGFKTVEVNVDARTKINVILEPDVLALNEAVVVGYGTQKKKDITGSVASLKSKDFNQGVLIGPEDALRGRIAGVTVSSVSSAPGAGSSVRIRGGTSITAGNEPLYVIDGFPIDNSPVDPGSGLINSDGAPSNPLSMLNPSDIASIDVLKDASATAIYGSRGANGVIIITTKRGRSGAANLTYNTSIGISNPINLLNLFTPDEFIIESNKITPGAIDPSTASRTDWIDEVTRTAYTKIHNISISGGNEGTTYSASVGYFDQEGIVKNSGVERLSSRLNVNHKALNNKLDIRVNLLGSFSNLTNLASGVQGTTGEGGVINNAIKASPVDPIFNPDGSLATSSLVTVDNPLAVLEIKDNTKNTRLLGNITAVLQLTDDFDLETKFGADQNIGKRQSFNPTSTRTGLVDGGRANIRERTLSSTLGEVLVRYDKNFGDHSLNALVGYSYQEFNTEEFGATATGFPTDAIQFYNLGLGQSDGFSANPPYSGRTSSKLISGIFRANYSYRDKYLLTTTYRRDGSTRFSENNQWGNFPSLSFAWRITQESFMQNSIFNDLKIRFGWGVTGSQEIPPNRSLNTFGPQGNSFNAQIGNSFLTGIAQNNVGNDDLTWEETTSLNLGLDLSLFNSRISATLDIYRKNTTDLLLESPLPSPSVASTRLANIGEVQNQGIEFSLETKNIDSEKFTWSTALNLAHNQNEIITLANDNADIISGQIRGAGISGTTTQILRVGEELGSFFGLVFTGIDPDTGQETFEDLDNDGTPDRQVIGSGQPDLTFGINNSFTYKNWDLAFFFQGTIGTDMFYVQRLELRTVGITNTFREYADYWTPENRNASLPALGEPRVFHDGLLDSGSFFRLSNATLGYRLPVENINWLNSARFYVNVQNAFIITDYKGFNPEVSVQNIGGVSSSPSIGIDTNGYPMAQTWNFGMQFNF